MAVWPVTLPDIPLVEGFSESAPDVTIRTQMDAGPARVRPRYTAGVRPVVGKISCTKAQVETLDVFHVTTLMNGSLPFDWAHPRTGVTKAFRFVKAPKYMPDHKDSWVVSLELEILP
jgi:hypothetical protein